MTPSQKILLSKFFTLTRFGKNILEEEAIKVPKLTSSTNYELWAIHIKAMLIIKDLFNFYIQSTEATTAKALKEDAKALSYI